MLPIDRARLTREPFVLLDDEASATNFDRLTVHMRAHREERF